MRQTTIWIDHHQAIIFDYKVDGIHEKKLQGHKHNGKATKEDLRKFYHDVANELSSADKILVVGPGLAKDEFKNHCEDHHQKVNKAILQIQTMKDHPSEEEILEVSKRFFKHEQAWSGI